MNAVKPGWYKSKADSDGVVRFWNGSAWAGDPIDKSLLAKRLAPYQYSLAPGMDRFLARLIDWFVWGAFYLVSDIVVDFFSLEPGLGQAIKLVGFATLVALYEAYFVSKNGATVGKRFLGVRIVSLEALDSGQPTFNKAITRIALFWLAITVSATGFAFLDSGIGGIGLVILVVPLVLHGMVSFRNDGFRRTTWDHISDTVVVKNYE